MSLDRRMQDMVQHMLDGAHVEQLPQVIYIEGFNCDGVSSRAIIAVQASVAHKLLAGMEHMAFRSSTGWQWMRGVEEGD